MVVSQFLVGTQQLFLENNCCDSDPDAASPVTLELTINSYFYYSVLIDCATFISIKVCEACPAVSGIELCLTSILTIRKQFN